MRAKFNSRSHISRLLVVAILLGLIIVAAGCRADMQDQPKMKPYRSSRFYRDGLSSRQPIEGTVARGYLKEDTEFFTGKKRGSGTSAPAATAGGAAPAGAAAYPDAVETFPFTVDEKVLRRGKERYEIFCSACHGLTGHGDGMVVRRGFRRAASFHDDRVRQAPVGHYFDAITNGWGVMPSYAAQIPARDRWAIIAYIRALQLSQENPQNQTSTSAPAAAPTPASGGNR